MAAIYLKLPCCSSPQYPGAYRILLTAAGEKGWKVVFLFGMPRPPPVNWSLINEAAFIRRQSRRVNHLDAAGSGQPAGEGGGVISGSRGLQTQHLLGPDLKSFEDSEGWVGVRGVRHAVGLWVIHSLHTFIHWSTGRALIGWLTAYLNPEQDVKWWRSTAMITLWPPEVWTPEFFLLALWVELALSLISQSALKRLWLLFRAAQIVVWLIDWLLYLRGSLEYSREEEWFLSYIVIVFVAVKLT